MRPHLSLHEQHSKPSHEKSQDHRRTQTIPIKTFRQREIDCKTHNQHSILNQFMYDQATWCSTYEWIAEHKRTQSSFGRDDCYPPSVDLGATRLPASIKNALPHVCPKDDRYDEEIFSMDLWSSLRRNIDNVPYAQFVLFLFVCLFVFETNTEIWHKIIWAKQQNWRRKQW